MAPLEPVRVVVHYDFASSLCYVAHRVLERQSGFLSEIAMELDWQPVDLARLMRWRRGAEVQRDRVQHVSQVAAELEVPLRVPPCWLDSRRAAAAALWLAERREAAPGAEQAWRERVFTRIYVEGGDCGEDGQIEHMARDLGLVFDERALEGAELELETRTLAAAGAMVTGVPTFMLGEWPLGGIQEDRTMRSILGRWAQRQRRAG